jgi:hypothetical protein
MTTKYELINEFKQFIEGKREEIETQADEEAMQWQEEAENEYAECHEVSKIEYEKILKHRLECIDFLEEIEEFVNQF